MVMKINAVDNLVKSFLDRYKIWKDNRKFYCQDTDPVAEVSPDGIPCFHYRDVANINACSNKLIAIDCLTEGLHSARYFSHYNRENHYLIFANGWWDTDKYSFGINYTLISSHFFLHDMADTYNTPMRFCYYLDKNYDFDKSKPMTFISTIGNTRLERNYLVDQLKNSLTYKNFILRYSGQDHGMKSDEVDVVSFERGKFDPYTHLLEEYYHNVSQTLPINMYNLARFNLVVETDINYQDEFFPTEKIFKALITGIPFVLVSTPFFLKHLRNLGFETYNKFWDESYDIELDVRTRIEKIVTLCNQLHNFDWEKHRSELELVKLKNRNNFLNLNRVIDKEFINFENTINRIAI
jgi:hypothetical protein